MNKRPVPLSCALAVVISSRHPRRLLKRFTCTGPDSIQYEYTIYDPDMWTRPWSAALPLKMNESSLFEYACHEGNYAMTNILSGARTEERAAVAEPGTR